MKLRYTILCFLMLGCTCAVAMRDNGLMVISGMFLFIYLVMLVYLRKPANG